MISEYLETLADRLSFDAALSRCVVREVEDHLCEAVAADRTPDRLEAERRAIASFGNPHVLAQEFALVSLVRRTRRVGVTVVLAVLAVLVAMKARVAWYGLVQWTLSEDARELGAIVISIDRCAFWLAAVIGTGALIYMGRARAGLQAGHRRRLRRVFLLCACATGSLVVTVISDGVLTALQLGTGLGVGSVIPIITMAVEIACAGSVIFLILDTMRRAASTEALLRM